MKLRELKLTIMGLMVSTSIFAQSLYTDNTFVHWKSLATSGRTSELYDALAKELQKSEPHPLTLNTWRSLAEYNQAELTAIVPESYKVQAMQLLSSVNAHQTGNIRGFIENESNPEYHLINGGFNYYLNGFSNYNSHKAYELAKQWYSSVNVKEFGILWTITELMQDNHEIYLKLKADLESGHFNSSPQFLTYLNAVVRFYPVQDRNLIAPIKKYLSSSADDPMAHRYLAKILKSNMHYEEAIKHFKRSIELDPFYEANYQDLIYCYDMRYEEANAIKTAKAANQILTPSDTVFYHLLLAEAYTSSKHYGKVAPHLEIALKDPTTASLKAYMEFKMAIDFEPLVLVELSTLLRHQTEDQNYYDKLIDFLYDIDEKDMALELARATVNKFEHPSTSNYDNLYFKLVDTTEKIKLLQKYLVLYPEHHERWYSQAFNYYYLNKFSDAKYAYERSLLYSPASSYSWKRLNECNNQISGDSGASLQLQKAIKELYYIPEVWEAYIGTVGRSEEARDTMWLSLLETYPDRYFPIDKVNWDMISNREWSQLKELFSKNKEQIMAYGNESEIVEYLYDQMYMYVAKAKYDKLSILEIKEAYALCDTFIAHYGQPKQAYYKKYEIAQGLQDRSAAGDHLEAALDNHPNMDNYRELWTKTSSPNRYKYMKRAIERNPYDSYWKRSFIQLNVNGLWGGSSIEALIEGEKYLDFFPEGRRQDRVKMFMETALGDFGDNIRMYQKQYKNKSTIGNSNLYINFYEQALNNAMKSSNQVVIDPKEHCATVISESGETMVLKENSSCGKTELLQKGEAFVKFSYTDDCALKGIYTGAGMVIELDYNEKGKIIATRTPELELFVSYDAFDHIKYLANKKDTVYTEYDSLGNLVKVESNGGYELTLKMTSMFTELLKYSKIPEQAYSNLKKGELPDLTKFDERYNDLKSNFEESVSAAYYSSAMEFSNYLLKNISADQDHAAELCELSINVINKIQNENKKIREAYTVPIIDNFYQCLLLTRRNGVSLEYWEDWTNSFEYLVTERQSQKKKKKYYDALLALEQRIYKTPIKLLKQSNWLIKNELNKQAFWKEVNTKTLISPDLIDGFEINCNYLYGEDLIALGTNRGLLIKFPEWRWYGYNKETNSLELNPAPSTLGASSNITSLAYSGDGRAVIGTEDGLIIWNPSNNEVKRLSMFDGLLSNRINELSGIKLSDGSIMILITTSKGFQTMDLDFKFTDYPEINDKRINDMYFKPGQNILFGTEEGVYSWNLDSFYQLTDHRANSVGYLDDNTPMYHDGVELFKVVHSNDMDNATVDLSMLSSNISTTERGKVYGLDHITLNGTPYLTALTDKGISIYRYSHFEHLQLKARDGSIPAIRSISEFGKTRLLQSNDKVFIFDRSKVNYESYVFDEIVDLENGVTLFAGSGSLKYSSSFNPSSIYTANIDYIDQDNDYYDGYYSSSSSDAIFKCSDNSVLFNSGTKICKGVVDSNGTISAKTLFRVELSGHENYNSSSSLINLIEDSKGHIWVSTELRLYHYTPDKAEPLEVFSYFDGDEKFDVQTNSLGRILELPDGRIWLCASNNNHNTYKNNSLDGGLFEYTDSGFSKLKMSGQEFQYFITSQTNISESEAILGSTSGIQMYKDGIITNNYFYINEAERNPTYVDLYKKHNALYLSTKGAKLGDIMIIGTPSGLIGYREGQWFELNKLNQLLPEIEEFQEYGGLHIYSVGVNNNVIYASTPKGTMIYDFGDQDPINLIIEPTEIDKMLVYKQAGSLKAQQSIVSEIPKNSEAGVILSEIEKNNNKISELKKMKAVVSENTMSGSPNKLNSDSIQEIVKTLDRKNASLFLSLKQQEPTIYQMLKIPPLDLMSSRNKLNEGECILQYIAMPDELFIHLLSKTHSEVFTVPIPRDTVLSLASNVHQLMKMHTGVNRGVEMDDYGVENEVVLTKGLKELYNWLIRPVEHKLGSYDIVFVVPTEQLFYVPFSSLIKEDKVNGDKYLVEDHNIGMLSSMYLFDLVYMMQEKSGGSIELFGDPDGSLPGAREEVEAIALSLPNAHKYIGSAANRAAFDKSAQSAELIHLATHGDLDDVDVSKSSLLFSDGKLSLPELITMRMPNANMVVLSACETGVGKEGLEYTSLARAFSGAGVPRVLATLWQVNDEASKDLMLHFYSALGEKSTKIEAFSEAQRKMIADERYRNDPYMWAGYYYIGKP